MPCIGVRGSPQKKHQGALHEYTSDAVSAGGLDLRVERDRTDRAGDFYVAGRHQKHNDGEDDFVPWSIHAPGRASCPMPNWKLNSTPRQEGYRQESH